MTQLTADCFAHGDALLSVEDAAALIAARVPAAAGVETVRLDDADGRVAAADIRAGADLPGFDNSAVDGYGVRFGDLAAAGPTRMPVGSRVAAGDLAPDADPDVDPWPGTAVRIFTGAPLPPGFDTVFMQEDVRLEGDAVLLPPGLPRGANRRPAGEDIRAGAVAVEAGRRLGPPDIALLAALGFGEVRVRTRLRVALASTGNELVEPGRPRRPGAIGDANRPFLAALLRRAGATVTDLGILPDDPDVIGAAFRAAAPTHDLILSSGGVSVGEEDHVKAAIGGMVFWRLAIKPGRPVAMGSVGGTAAVGLPGNPVAVYVAFLAVVRPLLARLGCARYVPPPRVPVEAAFAHSKKPGRREFVRVSLRGASGGRVEAVKFPREGSGLITSLTGSDGLAELHEDVLEVRPGDIVPFLPHSALL